MVDVADVAHEARLDERRRELVADPFDVHRAARGEVAQPLDQLRRTRRVGAARHRFAFGMVDGGAADRTAVRQRVDRQLLLAQLEHRADDARDHVARSEHDDVVADEQGVFHGAGGNFKRLQNKCDDEQAGDQHSGQRGQEFHRRLARLFVHRLVHAVFVNVLAASDFFFFLYSRHVGHPFKGISSRTPASADLHRCIFTSR